MLEKEHAVVGSVSKEEISAILADKFMAGKLGGEVGSPVLLRKRYVYDKAERPIEYNLGYYKANSFIYTVESQRT